MRLIGRGSNTEIASCSSRISFCVQKHVDRTTLQGRRLFPRLVFSLRAHKSRIVLHWMAKRGLLCFALHYDEFFKNALPWKSSEPVCINISPGGGQPCNIFMDLRKRCCLAKKGLDLVDKNQFLRFATLLIL